MNAEYGIAMLQDRLNQAGADDIQLSQVEVERLISLIQFLSRLREGACFKAVA
jgi:hypothetical protein